MESVNVQEDAFFEYTFSRVIEYRIKKPAEDSVLKPPTRRLRRVKNLIDSSNSESEAEDEPTHESTEDDIPYVPEDSEDDMHPTRLLTCEELEEMAQKNALELKALKLKPTSFRALDDDDDPKDRVVKEKKKAEVPEKTKLQSSTEQAAICLLGDEIPNSAENPEEQKPEFSTVESSVTVEEVISEEIEEEKPAEKYDSGLSIFVDQVAEKLTASPSAGVSALPIVPETYFTTLLLDSGKHYPFQIVKSEFANMDRLAILVRLGTQREEKFLQSESQLAHKWSLSHSSSPLLNPVFTNGQLSFYRQISPSLFMVPWNPVLEQSKCFSIKFNCVSAQLPEDFADDLHLLVEVYDQQNMKMMISKATYKVNLYWPGGSILNYTLLHLLSDILDEEDSKNLELQEFPLELTAKENVILPISFWRARPGFGAFSYVLDSPTSCFLFPTFMVDAPSTYLAKSVGYEFTLKPVNYETYGVVRTTIQLDFDAQSKKHKLVDLNNWSLFSSGQHALELDLNASELPNSVLDIIRTSTSCFSIIWAPSCLEQELKLVLKFNCASVELSQKQELCSDAKIGEPMFLLVDTFEMECKRGKQFKGDMSLSKKIDCAYCMITVLEQPLVKAQFDLDRDIFYVSFPTNEPPTTLNVYRPALAKTVLYTAPEYLVNLILFLTFDDKKYFSLTLTSLTRAALAEAVFALIKKHSASTVCSKWESRKIHDVRVIMKDKKIIKVLDGTGGETSDEKLEPIELENKSLYKCVFKLQDGGLEKEFIDIDLIENEELNQARKEELAVEFGTELLN